MSHRKDLAGKKFGYLTPIKVVGNNKRGRSIWECICDCGNTHKVDSSSLLSGKSKSCGCFFLEVCKGKNRTHGQSQTAEYKIWKGIKNRCYNEEEECYKNYGGRGIDVCDRWLNSFDNFLSDMGYRPSAAHSIDRFPNINGNYEPLNCRWATDVQQAGNRRSNRWIEMNGEKMIMADWAKRFNISTPWLHGLLSQKSTEEVYEYISKRLIRLQNQKSAAA